MQTTVSPCASTDINDSRPRVLSAIVRALLAGIIIRVGTHVFALRERGETIDDGEYAAQALGDGLFERFDGFSIDSGKQTPIKHWAISCDHGASPVRSVRNALSEMTDEQIELLHLSLVASTALSPRPIATALRTGMRLAEPPTHIYE